MLDVQTGLYRTFKETPFILLRSEKAPLFIDFFDRKTGCAICKDILLDFVIAIPYFLPAPDTFCVPFLRKT